MIEALNCPIYHNRFLRQFDIPISKNKRRNTSNKKVRRHHKHQQYQNSYVPVSGFNEIIQDRLQSDSNIQKPSTNTFIQAFVMTSFDHLPEPAGIKCPHSEQEPPDFYQLTLQLVEDMRCLLSKEHSLAYLRTSLQDVASECGEKVDGIMRDDAVFNLLFLHKGFYDFSVTTFCRAVYIIDHFILRVKVKPKYMSCVAAAAYFIAAKHCEPNESSHPTAYDLVNLTHCGGTGEDLNRMVAIIRNKLNMFIEGSTAVDYLDVLSVWAANVVTTDASKIEPATNPMFFLTSGDVRQRIVNRILYSLSSFECRSFSSACLALASLALECCSDQTMDSSKILYQLLPKFAEICNVSWQELEVCSMFVQRMYQQWYCNALPCSRGQLLWCVSRRTRASLCLMKERSCGLSAIREDRLEEEQGNCSDYDGGKGCMSG
jgi:hypothetical protein